MPWLGKVPQHWEILRGKHIFDPVDIRSQNGNEELLTVSANRGVIPRSTANVTMFEAESYTGYKLCWPGDLVINSLWAWAQGLGVSQHHGIVSSAYGVYRMKPTFRDYTQAIHYLVRSVPFQWELQVRSKGVWTSRLQLTDEAFLDAPFPIPTTDEQAAIVRYLDDADQRIRAYVSAKERLIALLEEERQAVIHQAVTQSLDPNVRLKPSGVEWLGDVPEHWEVTALYHKYSQILGKMLDAKKVVGDHLLPYLRNTDVQWDRINVDDLPTMDISPNEYERYTVRPDDLLVCEGGDVGRSALWSGELAICGFQKALHRLRSIRGDIPRFLYYVLRVASNRDVFNDGHVSTIAHLTGEKLRLHRFPFPPIPEQSAIVEHLDKATAETDAAIDRARRQIELMEEYRTRLIADVVTGKLDVREAAEWLPDRGDDMTLQRKETQWETLPPKSLITLEPGKAD